MRIRIEQACAGDAPGMALMVGELLHEIMAAAGGAVFNFSREDTIARAGDFLERGAYFVFLARDGETGTDAGFIALSEGHALYAEGAYGTIPELYVRPAYRSAGVGVSLIQKAKAFGQSRGWKRLEVTTPPLPQFDRTLRFYEAQGFGVTGGRKLRALL